MVSAGTSSSARPRPTTHQPNGLLVIGAGFGRTGTSSLQEALEILGFGPCYHMREVFRDPTGAEKWDAIGQKHHQTTAVTTDEWNDIFFGYRSTVDLPASTYYYQLMEQYPDAKVILTTRDPEKWYDSVLETIAPPTTLWKFLYRLTLLDRNNTKNSAATWQRMHENCIWKPFCGGSQYVRRDKQHMINSFNAWNELVTVTVPQEKLLVFNVKDGWKPLCEFLNVDVPVGKPFPHVWTTENFQVMIAQKRRRAIKRLVVVTGVLVIATITVGSAVITGCHWTN